MEKTTPVNNGNLYEKTAGFLRKFKVLDGSMLKLIALITMLIDHTGCFILKELAFANEPLLNVLGHSFSLYAISRLIGRIAFPIYCFLITEGFAHTSNRKRYGVNLFLFALISELPWNYAFTGTLFRHRQNVFVTLFLGYLALCMIDYFKDKPLLQYISVFVICMVVRYAACDYGLRGVLMICIFYLLKNTLILRDFLVVTVLAEGIKLFAAMIPINMYNGKRGFVKGKVLKYFFYVFYPLHLLVLGIIRWNFL